LYKNVERAKIEVKNFAERTLNGEAMPVTLSHSWNLMRFQNLPGKAMRYYLFEHSKKAAHIPATIAAWVKIVNKISHRVYNKLKPPASEAGAEAQSTHLAGI
jgi:hypothetical protein